MFDDVGIFLQLTLHKYDGIIRIVACNIIHLVNK